MANIIYRESTAPSIPVSTSAKGSPLTHLEVDGNFKSINDELVTKATTVDNVFTGQQTFKEIKESVYTISDAASFEIDPGNGSFQIVTLGANRTPAATNFESGQSVLLLVDDGAAYTINWTTINPVWKTNAGVAPTLNTSGYTHILLWKVSSTMYGARIGDA